MLADFSFSLTHRRFWWQIWRGGKEKPDIFLPLSVSSQVPAAFPLMPKSCQAGPPGLFQVTFSLEFSNHHHLCPLAQERQDFMLLLPMNQQLHSLPSDFHTCQQVLHPFICLRGVYILRTTMENRRTLRKGEKFEMCCLGSFNLLCPPLILLPVLCGFMGPSSLSYLNFLEKYKLSQAEVNKYE